MWSGWCLITPHPYTKSDRRRYYHHGHQPWRRPYTHAHWLHQKNSCDKCWYKTRNKTQSYKKSSSFPPAFIPLNTTGVLQKFKRRRDPISVIDDCLIFAEHVLLNTQFRQSKLLIFIEYKIHGSSCRRTDCHARVACGIPGRNATRSQCILNVSVKCCEAFM